MGFGWKTVGLFVPLLQAVLCQNWKASLPKNIVAISGSCVTVPCFFMVPSAWEAVLRNCTASGATWRRGKDFLPQLNAHVEILGDVSKKNCTTVFSNITTNKIVTYHFRLQCSENLKYTFKEGVSINIQEEAPPPQMTSDSQMLEGTRVTLQCWAPLSCVAQPPSITWLPRDASREERLEMQQNDEGQLAMVSTVTFTATADHHNQNISCLTTYRTTQQAFAKQANANQRLIIAYAPRNTVARLSVASPVPLGSIVRFTCSSEASPPVRRYIWFRVDYGKLTKVGDGDTLILQTTDMDSGSYLCDVQNLIGSQMSEAVSLLITIPADSGAGAGGYLLILVTMCALLVLLYILTLMLGVYKYKLLIRRLKQIELKGENIYSDLRRSSIISVYEQLQVRASQPPSPGDYENGGASGPLASLKNEPRKSRGGQSAIKM